MSFYKLLENIMSEEETPAMKAIRIGLNLDESFWDNFISLANNPKNLGELLDIRPEKIITWASKIKKNLDKVKKANKTNGKIKKKIINTGYSDISEEND